MPLCANVHLHLTYLLLFFSRLAVYLKVLMIECLFSLTLLDPCIMMVEGRYYSWGAVKVFYSCQYWSCALQTPTVLCKALWLTIFVLLCCLIVPVIWTTCLYQMNYYIIIIMEK